MFLDKLFAFIQVRAFTVFHSISLVDPSVHRELTINTKSCANKKSEWIFLSVKDVLRSPIVSVSIISVIFGVVLYFFHDYGIADFAVVTILAFLASDVLSLGFIRGGRGILQITLLGTQSQSRGYGFIVFFISILIVAVIVNLGTEWLVAYLSPFFSNVIDDIGMAIALSVLVYADMYLKFYAHN